MIATYLFGCHTYSFLQVSSGVTLETIGDFKSNKKNKLIIYFFFFFVSVFLSSLSLQILYMSDIENKEQVKVESSSPEIPPTEMTKVESTTDTAAVIHAEEDEFADAVDEINIKANQDLSNVISQLQGTVLANIPAGKEEIHIETVLEPNDIVLDTIPEDDVVAIPKNETTEAEEVTEATEDVPLDDIHAPSEPSSPRPKATDLQIATHFEQIRRSIDVPAGQNMADFVTPPTPGIAPTSMLGSEDENDDDLPKESNEETTVKPSVTNAITLSNINFDAVKPNFLTPRAQEKFGKCFYTVKRMERLNDRV